MRLLLVALVCVTVSSCDRRGPYTLATIQNRARFVALGESLTDVLRTGQRWDITALSGEAYDVNTNIQLVASREVDFAFTTSDISPQQPDVRTVLPLYPEILLVLYDPALGEPASLYDLLKGNKVGVGPRHLPISSILLQLIEDFGVSREEFTPVFQTVNDLNVTSGKMNVLVTFLGADPQGIEEQIKSGARLFSFDNVELDGKGSTIDGYLLTHPERRSFIIPKTTFERYPEKPVLTLAIIMTIITHRDMSPERVYEFVETVFDKSSYLFRKNPILGFLSTSFDEARLNFPLHEGTRQYLNRDQPSFLERYAEVIALLFSLSIVLVGAVGSANRMLRRRKKDRMDVYYRQVHEISLAPHENADDRRAALEALQTLKSRAIQQLQDEKLEASEAFTIFLDLLHHEVRRLETR